VIGWRTDYSSRRSSSARTTSRDPLDGVRGSIPVADPYHYVGNDVINRADPKGLQPLDTEFRNDDSDANLAFDLTDGKYDQFRDLSRKEIAGFMKDAVSSAAGHDLYKGDHRPFSTLFR